MTAGDVMDRAAALLNDIAKSVYSYTVQIPYLNAAMDELQETFEQNNIPATNEVSAVLAVPANTLVLTFSSSPAIPADLIEPRTLHERLNGTTDEFNEMTKMEFVPKSQVLTSNLGVWDWRDQEIHFVGANTIRDVKIDYIKQIFAPVTASTDVIALINSKSFLAYRTAGLCARYIGENETRADILDGFAVLAMDRVLGINVKGGQAIFTRRRPFRAGYRTRYGQ